jgi:hypothetical protein
MGEIKAVILSVAKNPRISLEAPRPTNGLESIVPTLSGQSGASSWPSALFLAIFPSSFGSSSAASCTFSSTYSSRYAPFAALDSYRHGQPSGRKVSDQEQETGNKLQFSSQIHHKRNSCRDSTTRDHRRRRNLSAPRPIGDQTSYLNTGSIGRLKLFFRCLQGSELNILPCHIAVCHNDALLAICIAAQRDL